jgi:hypothetical protein
MMKTILKMTKVLILSFSLLVCIAPKRSEALVLAASGVVTGGWATTFYIVGGFWSLVVLSEAIGSNSSPFNDSLATFALLGSIVLDEESSSVIDSRKLKIEELTEVGYEKETAVKIKKELAIIDAIIDAHKTPIQYDLNQKELNSIESHDVRNVQIVKGLQETIVAALNKNKTENEKKVSISLDTAEYLAETLLGLTPAN